MKNFSEYGVHWIWISEDEQDVNQYVEFRKEFFIENLTGKKASLFIAADSNYAVWMNDIFVNCGQFNNYPEDKTYDVLEVGEMLHSGENVLCIIAYYQGRNSFSYLKGDPGILFYLDGGNFSIASNSQILCRKSRTYKNGPIYDITPQLAFAFMYDARNEDHWLMKDYKVYDSWKKAKIMTGQEGIYKLDLKQRPLKKLDIHERTEMHIITQGVFMRISEEADTPAEQVQTDFLSSRLLDDLCPGESQKPNNFAADVFQINPALFDANNGVYFVIDLGQEEAGLFELEVETDEGTVIDVAHGEHLDDLRVRASVGGRNFANRYICCEGQQGFIYPFKRLGCRFIEIHVLNVKSRFALQYVGLRPVEYPVEEKGRFKCSDSLYNRIYQTGVRTLHLCMHEHYEDTPWREQALYAMDSRNQALCGYYCFGEYDFPDVSFSLLGNSLKEDGYLEIVAPSQIEITIPSFSMAWVQEVWEYYLYSGRLEAVRRLAPLIEKMMKAHIGNIRDGLLITPNDKRYWNFYEWADGLEGCIYKESPEPSIKYDAPFNLFFHIALICGAKLFEAIGELERAVEYRAWAAYLKECFHKKFWVESKHLYQTYVGGIPEKEHYAELTQALAIYSGVCPQSLTSELRHKLALQENDMVKTTLSHSIYKFEALLGEPDKYGQLVFDSIAKDWGNMLYRGATSFWETIKGADDFDKAGSLCHGWSAIPVYIYHAYILGIKPVEPGFKVFEAKPLTNALYHASGKVPTPYGDIELAWEKCGDSINKHLCAPGLIRNMNE